MEDTAPEGFPFTQRWSFFWGCLSEGGHVWLGELFVRWMGSRSRIEWKRSVIGLRIVFTLHLGFRIIDAEAGVVVGC